MSDQPDPPENEKKPVRVAIIGHVGYSRASMLAAMGVALASANIAVVEQDAERILLDGPSSLPLDWCEMVATMEVMEPRCTRPSPNHGDRTYENPFSRRARRRR